VGQCAEGLTQGCAPDGTAICVQVHQPSPETCDGKDNDCNGKVDEGVHQACHCGGTQTCSNGQWGSCNLPAGVCTSYGYNGCGFPFAAQCVADNQCGPNMRCDPVYFVCTAALPLGGCSMPSCWLPSDLNYDRSKCFQVH
jgi:hypothetical protein